MCINLKCGEFGEKTKSNVSNISKDETNTKTADEIRYNVVFYLKRKYFHY